MKKLILNIEEIDFYFFGQAINQSKKSEKKKNRYDFVNIISVIS